MGQIWGLNRGPPPPPFDIFSNIDIFYIAFSALFKFNIASERCKPPSLFLFFIFYFLFFMFYNVDIFYIDFSALFEFNMVTSGV